jgi:diguanylate cyclase (GGDEF)-like protein/PAS domain S-box-containing protein
LIRRCFADSFRSHPCSSSSVALVLIAASGAEIALGMRGSARGNAMAAGRAARCARRRLGAAALHRGADHAPLDAAHRRASSGRCAKSEERLRLVANSVPALISYLDRESRFRFSNRTYDDWFGIPQERMHGRTVAEVFGEDIHARMKPHIERVLSGEEVEFEFSLGEKPGLRLAPAHAAGGVRAAPRARRRGARLLHARQRRHRAQARAGGPALRRDPAAARRAGRLEFLAHHDTLTGLPNRAMFQERAREAVAHARRHDKTAAVLFIDLDNFKQVNDGLGHDVGDGLLKVIASRLRACVRGDDFIARIGGDEFCVLLQEIAEPREAAAVAQKLVYELARPYRIGEHSVSCGASVGIACVPQDGHDVATLLRLADAAMYRAKEAGRNGYQFFSVVLNQDAAAAAALADELKLGIGRGELFLVYQPRIDIATRQVVGAEALLRWRHPPLRRARPGGVPAARRRHGLLVPIGAWVLREACMQGRRWLDAGIKPLSRGREHHRAAAAPRLARRRSARGARGERAAAGVAADRGARDAAAPDARAARGELRRRRRDRARLGVDDFGTGYAFASNAAARARERRVHRPQAQSPGCRSTRSAPASPRRSSPSPAASTSTSSPRASRPTPSATFLAEAGCRVFQGDLFARQTRPRDRAASARAARRLVPGFLR